ncbi:MAG TPA: hypothetical protein VF824_08495 [Thermoanaerobaculia bacterium]
MPFRKHFLTEEPVLHAPARAARPRAFDDAPAELERCPFCPGHESDTPPELARRGDPWLVRAVPNKYPPAAGAEVLVESPRHDDAFHDVADPAAVVELWLERYRARRDAAYVSLFKNHGARAGSSIPHVHSQLVPLPFLPPRIVRESSAFSSSCPLCAIPGVVIRETETMIAFAPSPSTMPYQQWLAPKRHVHDFASFDARELADLAVLLADASRASLSLGDAYNWAFINFPHETRAHAYVDVFPRITTIAGFELGTGTFVEIIEPADAARRLARR